MQEKRCEWCGTVSPADAERCTLCRVPLTAHVPPPQDWSHLTGNIPVVTAPLLQEAPPAPVFPDPTPVPAAPEPPALFVDERAPIAAPRPPLEPAATPTPPAVEAPAIVRPAAEQAATAAGRQPLMVPGLAIEAVAVPGWRAPDDPTLQVFRHELALRDQHSGRASRGPGRPRRPRRRLRRVMVWLIGLALLVAALLMAPARLPLL